MRIRQEYRLNIKSMTRIISNINSNVVMLTYLLSTYYMSPSTSNFKNNYLTDFTVLSSRSTLKLENPESVLLRILIRITLDN